MHLYQVVAEDGLKLSVFAPDFNEAAIMFTQWHSVTHGSPLPDFEVLQRNPRWDGLNRKHAREALAREVAGIGTYDPKAGWTISPLLHRGGQ